MSAHSHPNHHSAEIVLRPVSKEAIVIIDTMSSDQQQPPKGKISADEKNMVVSFIQFLRQKVSAHQVTDEQLEGLEGETILVGCHHSHPIPISVAVQCLESAF